MPADAPAATFHEPVPTEDGPCSVCGEEPVISEVHHPPGATLHLGGRAWAHPSLTDLLEPITELTPHPQNARRGDLAAIRDSLLANGMFRPVYARTATSHLLAGNHTHAALLLLGANYAPTVWLDVTEEQAKRILLADNRTAELGGYDDAALLELITSLEHTDLAYVGTGWDDIAVAELAASIAAADDDLGTNDDDDGRAPTTGEQLSIADVTWGEPHHKIHHGEVWQLGRHILVVAKLHDEHHLWRPLLTDERVFAPYPEPYLTTSEVARDRPLLLVQPNVYLGGHLLDKHASVFPDEQPARLEPKS